MSVKVFWISTLAWQYRCSQLDLFRGFFLGSVMFLVWVGYFFLSPNFCHWDANRRSHRWWWILEVSYLPTELCFSEVSTSTWEVGMLQQCHCWEKSLSPCHFNCTLQTVLLQSALLLMGTCPAPFSLPAWRCYPGPTRAAKALLSLCFQQEKCLSDVGGGRVGGSPWLVRKHCFYVISFHTPAMCGK